MNVSCASSDIKDLRLQRSVFELISSYSGEEVELRFGFLLKENRRENNMVNDCKEVHKNSTEKFDLERNKMNQLIYTQTNRYTNKERAADTLCERALLKTFQNRRVSSPAPVTIASPSGDTACDQ